MKRKSFFGILTFTITSMLVMSACGPSTASNETTTQAADTTQAATTTQAENTTAAQTEGDKNTIRYFSMWQETEPQAEVIKEAITEFESQNSNVKFEVQWLGRDISKTIKASLDAHQVDIWDQGINVVVENYSDYGIEMDSLFDKAYPATDGKPLKDLITGSLIAAVKQYSPDGKMHAAPYQPNVVGFFYNKKMFDENSVKVPTNWDEFMTACETLKAAGITPTSVDAGYALLPYSSYIGRLKGVDFVKELVTDKTGAKWDDPAVLEAAKVFEDMSKKGYYDPAVAAFQYPAGQNEVALGNAAMYLVGSYMLNEVKEMAGDDFEWGCFAFPSPTGSAMDNGANIYGTQTMQITKDCKDPEAAMAFIASLTTGKFDKEMADKCSAIPTSKDTPWPTLLASAKEVLDSSTVNVPWAFGINANPDTTPVLKDNMSKLYGGQMTAEEFVADGKKVTMGQ